MIPLTNARGIISHTFMTLTNVPNPRKWWFTVKAAVFGTSSSLPPLVDTGGKLA